MFKRFKIMCLIAILFVAGVGFTNHTFASTGNETIMGSSVLTSRQMGDYVLLNNNNPQLMGVNVYQLADLYLSIGRLEGVRGDIAFAQAILESGYFKFGGAVLPEQNNYAGIGTTGGGVKGNYFATPEEGVRAQIQHLKAYGSTDPLVTEKVDPRFDYVKRGIAPKWTDLNGRWAVPGTTYGQNILSVYDKMSEITLTIPNTILPSNHNLPVAKLVPRQDVEMLKPDGTFYQMLEKDKGYRVYDVLGNYYNVGGGYLVAADSSKMGVYIGRLLMKDDSTPLYAPDGTIVRNFTKGEAIRVYSYDDNRYDVGGGYYVMKTNKHTYYMGMVTIKQNTTLYDPNGNSYKQLNKNERYRVYNIDGKKLDLGGGYYVLYDRNVTDYLN